MVALVGAFGFFHLAQQGIHLRNRQQAPCTHRAVASHGGEQFVTPSRHQLRDAVFAQFTEQRARQIGRVGGLQQCGNGTHGELCGADGCEVEAEFVQDVLRPPPHQAHRR